MASIRKQIRDHAKELLNGDTVPVGGVPGGGTKPAGLSIHSFRTRPLEQDSLPAGVVYSGEEGIERSSHAPDVMREYRMIVEWRVKDDVEDALDPLLTWGTRVMLADPTLGGLAVDVEETNIEWAAEERDRVFGAAAQVFRVKYRTDLDDPEAQS